MIDPLHPTDVELSTQPETGIGELRLDLVRRLVAEAVGTCRSALQPDRHTRRPPARHHLHP